MDLWERSIRHWLARGGSGLPLIPLLQAASLVRALTNFRQRGFVEVLKALGTVGKQRYENFIAAALAAAPVRRSLDPSL